MRTKLAGRRRRKSGRRSGGVGRSSSSVRRYVDRPKRERLSTLRPVQTRSFVRIRAPGWVFGSRSLGSGGGCGRQRRRDWRTGGGRGRRESVPSCRAAAVRPAGLLWSRPRRVSAGGRGCVWCERGAIPLRPALEGRHKTRRLEKHMDGGRRTDEGGGSREATSDETMQAEEGAAVPQWVCVSSPVQRSVQRCQIRGGGLVQNVLKDDAVVCEGERRVVGTSSLGTNAESKQKPEYLSLPQS